MVLAIAMVVPISAQNMPIEKPAVPATRRIARTNAVQASGIIRERGHHHEGYRV